MPKMKEDKHITAEIIKAFVDKYLDGDINRLPDFQLSKLWKDDEFGCPGRERYDNDDTEIMRAIYVLVFSDVWPALSMDSLAKYRYRGDTMNTYNTLFGHPQYGVSMHPKFDRFSPPKELSEKVIDFLLNHCNRIGNMVVLPNIWYKGTTINRYRGVHEMWHDFFDRFLVAFRNCLIGVEKIDADLNELIRANAEYLRHFMSADGFSLLAKSLFFEDYLDENGIPFINSKGYCFWDYSISREDYFEEVNRYIDFAKEVIKHRGQRMLEELKQQLS